LSRYTRGDPNAVFDAIGMVKAAMQGIPLDANSVRVSR